MPLPGFLSSMADKAQNALKDTPIAQHIPGASRPSSDAPAAPTNSGPTQRGHAFDQIQHQFRQLQQNYSSATPVQKIITAEKGVALDVESLSRDSQVQSKELYHWGQKEGSDVKDASDRLAFLNYTAGSLANTLSTKLNTARAPFKELRDFEGPLLQKRNIRNGMELQISRVENSREKGYEKHLAELKGQLAKAEYDDEPLEKQHEILLRKALKESERQKFQALREFGEKISLLAQAAESVLTVLPSVPPSTSQPYTATDETGNIRASLQYALDHWKPGQTTLSAPAEAILDRSNTGSFGETHAQELQQITTATASTTSPVQVPVPVPVQEPGSPSSPPSTLQTKRESVSSPLTADAATPPGINPAALNTEPTPIPSGSPPVAVTVPGSTDSEVKVPTVTPTVAETGVPVSGGPGGPGPSSGSLHDIRSSPQESSKATYGITESPVQEASSSSGPAKQYESAEEEKRRLEREERERLLRSGTQSGDPSATDRQDDPNADDGETLPPYREI